jgi:uncharacterized Fe-S cluster-containing protein
VQDLQTGENFTIGDVDHCRTCGSEIIASINDSNFQEGECGACEYQRYRSQPRLLEACKGACGLVYRDKNNDERIDLVQYEQAERTCRSAIANSDHGSTE